MSHVRHQMTQNFLNRLCRRRMPEFSEISLSFEVERAAALTVSKSRTVGIGIRAIGLGFLGAMGKTDDRPSGIIIRIGVFLADHIITEITFLVFPETRFFIVAAQDRFAMGAIWFNGPFFGIGPLKLDQLGQRYPNDVVRIVRWISIAGFKHFVI